MSAGWRVALLGLLVASLLPAARADASALIDNGMIQLGVEDRGHLNVPGGPPASDGFTTTVGLRYMPNNAEALGRTPYDGWGAADATSHVTGFANSGLPGHPSFNAGAGAGAGASATLRVTHDFHPAPAMPTLYEVAVTIKHVSSNPVDPRTALDEQRGLLISRSAHRTGLCSCGGPRSPASASALGSASRPPRWPARARRASRSRADVRVQTPGTSGAGRRSRRASPSATTTVIRLGGAGRRPRYGRALRVASPQLPLVGHIPGYDRPVMPIDQQQRLATAAAEAHAAEDRGDIWAANDAWRRYVLIADGLRDPQELLDEGVALSKVAIDLWQQR